MSGRDAPAQPAAPGQPVFPIPDTRAAAPRQFSEGDAESEELPPAPTAWGHFPDDMRPAGLDSEEMPPAGLPEVVFDGVPLGATQPSFDHASLASLCQNASEIGYQLSIAYAMARTVRTALRAALNVDDDDLPLCLDAGVIDVLDAQHRRLALLQDPLSRAFCAAHRTPAAGSSVRRHKRTRAEDL